MRKITRYGTLSGLAATFLGLAVTARAESREPMKVAVVAHQGVQPPADDQKKALRKDARAKAKDANKSLSALEKDLKKQHGKKVSAWPAEAAAGYVKQYNTWGELYLKGEYLDADQKDVDDSANDIKRAIAGKGLLVSAKDLIRDVQTAAEADLVTEVLTRRSWKSTPFQVRPDWYYVCFKLSAGGRLDAAKLAALRYDWPGNSLVIHYPTTAEPFWIIQGADPERWSDAANFCSQLLQSFIGDNHAALLAARTRK